MAEEQKPAEAAGGENAEALRPIIRKIIVEDGHAGAHGGAWKIALADMMTAMMAFFLLMWLLGASNEDKRKSIADYFRPASHSQIKFGELAGSNGLLGGKSIVDTEGFAFTARQTALLERLTPRSEAGPSTSDGSSEEARNREGPSDDTPKDAAAAEKQKRDKENFDKLEKDLKQKINESKQFEKLKDQVTVAREKDGLRIELIDKADYSMFRLGTSELDGKAARLVSQIASSLQGMPNKVAIRGHTDSLGFAPDSMRNNWSLSSERADATRQLMQASGIPSNRFSRIEGVADTNPYNPSNPSDPRNRRISITVLNQE